MACPCEQALPLGNYPVLPAIETDGDDAGDGSLGGDEGGDGARGRDLLVEEGNAGGGAAEGLEEGEGGARMLRLAAQGDQGATACVERL